MTSLADLDVAAVRTRLTGFETLSTRMQPDPPGFDFGPTVPEIRAAFTALLDDALALLAAVDDAAAERAAAAIIRGVRVDPLLLRWCEWPGCWASFDAATGPVDDPGWLLASHRTMLLCPPHAAGGHVPDWTYDRTLRTVTAECSCGEAEDVIPGNQDSVTRWWRGHVTDLAAKAT